MLIAALTIGDTSVTLHAVQTLEPKTDEIPFTYTLSFHDLPTGTKEDIVYGGECDALYALAAWIASDEESLGHLDRSRTELEKRITAKRLFLP